MLSTEINDINVLSTASSLRGCYACSERWPGSPGRKRVMVRHHSDVSVDLTQRPGWLSPPPFHLPSSIFAGCASLL